MSYNYRYHQQGVGHIKRQQQLRQNTRSQGGGVIGALVSLIFKLIGELIKTGIFLLICGFVISLLLHR